MESSTPSLSKSSANAGLRGILVKVVTSNNRNGKTCIFFNPKNTLRIQLLNLTLESTKNRNSSAKRFHVRQKNSINLSKPKQDLNS